MNLLDFTLSPLSLLPPLIALGLAIITRRVLISLGMGILIGGLLITDYSIIDTTQYIWNKLYGVVIETNVVVIEGIKVEESNINSWNMSIVAFLLLLGMITALLTLSGGTRAFANWAQSRVKSKRGSTLLAAVLGVFVFVDDYFNSLAVGAISRPVTDRFYVSRSKLAYILDSTAAPMCVLMPLSSWGAYIMAIVGGILVAHGLTEHPSPLSVYVSMIPMNFYAVFALLMVFAVVWFQLDVGPMRKQEMDASLNGNVDRPTNESDRELSKDLDIDGSDNGSLLDLIMPITTLILSTISFMLYTGAQSLANSGKEFDLFGAFENTDVGLSLCYGGLIGLATALITIFRQQIKFSQITRALWIGLSSMLGAIVILFFAWTIGSVIGDLKTGTYLASLVNGSIHPNWLPVILFLLSGVMAFSTGTSWGTFGIMLPIAGDMAGASDVTLMLPMLSAVLAGSVFGDHCSPISDTTILSSTGARCNHIDHVATQLPYALSVAFVSCIGFIVLGMTSSILLSFTAASVTFIIVCGVLGILSKRKQSPTTAGSFIKE